MRVILNWKEKKKKKKRKRKMKTFIRCFSRERNFVSFFVNYFFFLFLFPVSSYQEIYFVVENRDKISTNGWARNRLITG